MDIVGTVFAGYRIEAVVGRGGMGVVYRATQLDLGRTVALKVIAGDLLEDAAARRRFVQESRLAASIEHPHVIPIHSAGEQDGIPYIAMRYVGGDDARTLVRREGPLAPLRAASIVAQVAAALDAAHAAGLVHRDVKPANVLLTADDHVYLTDFGLTRHVRSIAGGATTPGHWVGTLDYVAPEQIRSDSADARTDVYALGCLLFYLLTGSVPFPREGDEARLWAHLTERPPAVPEHVPKAFDAVIARALAKAPDDRYPSAGDLGRAALAAAGGERVTSPERAVASGAAAAVEHPTRTSAPQPRRRRRTRTAAALVGLPAAVVAALAILALERDEEAPSPPARDERAVEAPPEQPRIVARIPVGRRPNTLVEAGGRVWVGAFDSPTLDAIHARTQRRIDRLRPNVGDGTVDIALARDQLWVATRGLQIVRLDAAQGRPVGSPIALPYEPVEIAARGDNVVAGVETMANELPYARLLRFDASSGEVVASRRVAHGIAGLVFARGWLWTLHGDSNFIVRRHPRTLRARQRIPLPGTTVGALAYGSDALWVTVPDQDLLVRYRPATGHRAEVEVGARPIGVVVRNRRVWVAASGSSTIEQIRARGMRRIGEPIRTPLNPFTLAIDRKGIWVTCVGEDVVARVELPA